MSAPRAGRGCWRSASSKSCVTALAVRLEDARGELSRRAFVEQEHVERIERMIAEPERHKWVRVSNRDIGEPGCKFWHSRPRLGLIGMLLGWWRVKISSGCP